MSRRWWKTVGAVVVLAAWMTLVLIVGAIVAAADTYPNPPWDADATIDAMGGTTHQKTAVPIVAKGTSPQSTPPLFTQYTRQWARNLEILAGLNELSVWKMTANTIGVFPGYLRIAGVDLHYAGTSTQAVSSTNDTYYVYITNSAGSPLLNVVTDAVGWPADLATHIPLAEVTVAGNVITAITDVRNRVRLATTSAGGAAGTGTTETYFTLDTDNSGAGASCEFRVNRGNSGNDAGLRWDETDDRWEILIDRDSPTLAAMQALTLDLTQTTGTAPMTVASMTKVANLNVDAVDGRSLGTLGGAGGIAYASAADTISATAAGTSGQILRSGAAGAPTWESIGAAGGAQEQDDLLDKIADCNGGGTDGLLALDENVPAVYPRQIVGAGPITLANGSGVAGNPTITWTQTESSVTVGGTGGTGITAVGPGTDNTVLVGRTGNTPTFRKIVTADLDSEAVTTGKIANYTITNLDLNSNLASYFLAIEDYSIGNEAGNAIIVYVWTADIISTSRQSLLDAWLADSATNPTLTATEPNGGISVTVGTLLQTVVANKHLRVVTSAANGEMNLTITHSGTKTYYLWISLGGKITVTTGISFS